MTLRRTPLYEEHRQLGARLVPFAGWEMAIQYKGIVAEHHAVRQRAGLFDVSHMGELWVTGSGAADAVNELVTNDIGRLDDGRAMYTCCCNEEGNILDDLIVYRCDRTRVLVVCNAGNHDKIAAHFERYLAGQSARRAATANETGRAHFDDASDRTALLALQGPRALEVLGLADAAGGERARALGSFRFAELTLLGKACTVARTGYTGEDGVEIFCAAEDAARLWRGLLEAGAGVGIEPVGLGARDTLRLEARLALYGNDIDETTNPFEAGLGWTVKLDKSSFVGKAALERVKVQGVARRLAGFEMTGRGVARHGYPLLSPAGAVGQSGRSAAPAYQTVGVCTSGAPSPTLGKSIGLGYLPRELSEVGTDFLVDCRGRAVSARVVPTPFYKRATTG